MPVSGPILVFLANGTQGSAVARVARERGHLARGLIRKRSSDSAGHAVIGDLDDPVSLAAAAEGCAHAVLQVPTGEQPTMIRQVGNALDALRHARVRSIVLKLASASRPAPCNEPSFVANAAIEALVRSAGIPVAIVRPTMYLDNLLKPSARADIAERGVFSPPIASEQRIAWTSADDCALAAIVLLEQDRFGGDHLVSGPESVTGDELESRLSAALGKPISYHAEPLDVFERDVDVAMGLGMGRRIASKFRYFREHPDEADQILATVQDPKGLPGFTPTSIKAWARQRRQLFQ
ncbi:NmrA family NAD(P)-binding protein [Granulibacter bethesdensis]|uniref:Nucleoside-diphosphate-sugar epimerase n=1 Tax=Granulibacter bethesdensis (strain ATCC BAA-1260 / CGDNIH1) TaxID=391165 RepID=Q0BR61_GRABC|nr:NmrA family NAD(P)-binding protein [Granulibacter bethesdensis]ABI62691.1 Nucleoside-diphosphate-sugar epimerase [Granulibacter bethesdensis CGDNIH1]APG30735.1 Nucleoside-diphosphate-sugar epimerase [Granulibacter bethesdensis]APH52549.1 Nucleoside-diphosphate-sugar epimerase [Granulibacter bethesdensis]APH65238.1 Nucleoside-diphosphate-sugar epimerase [Granulibacter bethesdensis]